MITDITIGYRKRGTHKARTIANALKIINICESKGKEGVEADKKAMADYNLTLVNRLAEI